jgi:hypothetical protein
MEPSLALRVIVIPLVGGAILFFVVQTLFAGPITSYRNAINANKHLSLVTSGAYWLITAAGVVIVARCGYVHLLQEVDAYKGVVHNKMSMIGALQAVSLLATAMVVSVALPAVLVPFSGKSGRVLFLPLLLNLSVLGAPLLRHVAPSYDSIVSRRAKRVVSSKTFQELRTEFDKQDFVKIISILDRKSYVIVDSTVINLDAMSAGPVPALGFVGLYYQSADSAKYDSFSDLFAATNLDSALFYQLYNGLLANGLLEARRRTTCDNLSEFLFHSTCMYGERAVVETSAGCPPDSGRGSLLISRDLGDGLVYVRRSGWQPF